MKNSKMTFKFWIPADLKSVKSKDGQEDFYLEGYAATNDLDRQDEVVTTEALEKGVLDLKENDTVFYEHKSDEHPIGKIVEAKLIKSEGTENSDKLFVKVFISKTAEKIRTLIKEGILRKFSIGGEVLEKEAAVDEKTGKKITRILDMSLYEVSVVGLPANIKAAATNYTEGKSISHYIFKSLKLDNKENGGGEKMADKEKKDIVTESVEKVLPKEELKVEKTDTTKKEEVIKEEVVEKKETPKEEKAEKTEESEVEKTDTSKKEASKEETTVEKEEIVKQEEEITDEDLVECSGCGEKVKPDEEGKCPKCGYQIVEKTEEKSINDVLTAITELKDAILTAVNKISGKKEEKTTKVPETKNIDEIVKKAVDEKLKDFKVVKSRKGLVLKEDRTEKDKETTKSETPLDILNDKDGFEKLEAKDKSDVIRKGLLSILRGNK